MGCVSVEITWISARDLENPAFNTAYAMAWINDDFINKQQMPVDRVNGTNLTWNHCIRFTRQLVALRQGNLILVIGIFTKAPIGDTEINRVHIPLKDFVEPGCPMSLTRTIRTPSQSLDISLNIKFSNQPQQQHHCYPSHGYHASLPRYQQYPPPHLPPYQGYPSPHQGYRPVLPQPHQPIIFGSSANHIAGSVSPLSYQSYPSPYQDNQLLVPQPHQTSAFASSANYVARIVPSPPPPFQGHPSPYHGYQPIVPQLNPPSMLASVARQFVGGVSGAVGEFVGQDLIQGWNASN